MLHAALPGIAQRCLTLPAPSYRCRSEDNQRLAGELERAQAGQAELSGSMQRLEAEAAEARQASSSRDGHVRAALLRLATASARQEREIVHQRLQASAPRLGCLGVRRRGIDVQEVGGAVSGCFGRANRQAALACLRAGQPGCLPGWACTPL